MTEKKLPPRAPTVFNYTPESIAAITDSLIARMRAVTDKVVAETTVENATFDNTLRPILQAQNLVYPESLTIRFLSFVHPDAAIIKAASKLEAALNDLDIELSMRQDMFDRVSAVYQRRESAGLDPEALYSLEKMHKQYIDAGLLIPIGASRDRFKQAQVDINRLCEEERSNINSEVGGIFFTPEELEGVPEDALKIGDLEKGTGEHGGKVKVGFKRDVYTSVMAYTARAETRRDYYIANQNKLNKNGPLLKQIILLRDEAARLLGFKNHAAVKISAQMAKTPENVNNLLADIQSRVASSTKSEVALLLKRKKADYEARGLEFDGEFYIWDLDYYERLQKEQEYSVDDQAVAEYFALWPTFNGMLGIFSKLFGLRFEQLDEAVKARISPTGNASDVTWHEDVYMYAVYDEDASFMGYLYLDMHPRPNKYPGEANACIGPASSDNSDGRRKLPFTVLMCNLPSPTKDKPSLLKHADAVMLFHELGHGIHSLVSKTKYAINHGSNGPRDFVEAPSQMLENWCWVPDVLKSLSSHWQTGQPITDDLVNKLVKTKNFNRGINVAGMLVLSTFDMLIHTPESHEALEATDIISLWNKRRAEVSGIKGPESAGYGMHWGQGCSNSHHIVSGYDAGYYCYLYSQVFSTDMYYAAFKADPLSSEAGRRYRRIVLEKGASCPELELLTEYLGREPNSDAFFDDIGLS